MFGSPHSKMLSEAAKNSVQICTSENLEDDAFLLVPTSCRREEMGAHPRVSFPKGSETDAFPFP